MSKFEKQKRAAITIVRLAFIDAVGAVLLCWMGIWTPWVDRINWFTIPNWYYAFTVVLMCIVEIVGVRWIKAQEE